jgi:ABC-type uncharacterized transport system permease subunit
MDSLFPFFLAAVTLWGLTAVAYLGFLAGLDERAAVWARRLAALAVIASTLEVGARGVAGLHPVSSVRETIGFATWLLGVVFLLAQRTHKLDAVGAVVAPAAVIGLVAARLSPSVETGTSGLGVLGRVHISLAGVGLAVFALATASAILYLLEERQLKHKRLTAIVKKGLALETLDKLAHRCVQIGFPVFTVAMVTGAMWSARVGAGYRPEYGIAVVAWIAFAAILVARVTAGWRGRRAALMTIVGFAAALTVLGVYLIRAAAE